MRALGKFLAFLCALVFLASGTAALLLFNAEAKLLRADAYKAVLARENLYAELPAVFASLIVDGPGGGNMFVSSTPQQTIAFMAALMPESEMRPFVDAALDQTIGFVRGDVTDASIDLTLLSDGLRARAFDAVAAATAASPACGGARAVRYGRGHLFECQPPEALRPQIRAAFAAAAEALPPSIDLFAVASAPTGAGDLGAGANRVRLIRWFQLSPLVPAACLVLIALCAVRSARGLLRWWGPPLLLLGLIGLGLGALIKAWGADNAGLFTAALAANSDAAEVVLAHVSTAMLAALGDAIIPQAGVLAALGAAMWATGTLMRRRRRRRPGGMRPVASAEAESDTTDK